MLKSNNIILRPIIESDLALMWERHADIEDRGVYFPMGVMSQNLFRQQFAESGFWGEDSGMLVITAASTGDIAGHIEFFRTLKYLDEIELSYQIYGTQNRGKGIATESVQLMTKYLFEKTKINRIRLMIHPENKPSVRVAEKAGYHYESTSKGIWYNRGKYYDLLVYVLLRDEFFGE
ncbi:MAG: GNAT family N-acetyltransferase [Ignavibacteria bacterium]|nr:GNAT family N-acetyltransferase [Ignavibacteria bacterium]